MVTKQSYIFFVTVKEGFCCNNVPYSKIRVVSNNPTAASYAGITHFLRGHVCKGVSLTLQGFKSPLTTRFLDFITRCAKTSTSPKQGTCLFRMKFGVPHYRGVGVPPFKKNPARIPALYTLHGHRKYC